jgi:hypothetical protein
MLRPSSTPVRTSQARLVACHVGASLLQGGEWKSELIAWSADVRTNVHDTIGVLSDLVREREARPDVRGDSTGQFAILLDEALEGVGQRTSGAGDPVGDIAFIAGSQLRRKAAELDDILGVGREDPRADARLTEVLGSCLRHVLKATATVEPILAATYGLQPRLSVSEERARSLAVRRAYTQFRRAVLAASPDRHGLAAVRTALGALFSDPAFRAARPSDRVELQALAGRVEAVSPQGDHLDVERLLSDVTSFATMLRIVDRREVLLIHDLEVLPEVIDHVTALLHAGKPVLRGHLDRIRGIDDRVESLLDPGLQIDGWRLVGELERVWGERRQIAGIP